MKPASRRSTSVRLRQSCDETRTIELEAKVFISLFGTQLGQDSEQLVNGNVLRDQGRVSAVQTNSP